MKRLAATGLAVAAVNVVYGFVFERGWLRVRQLTIPFSQLPSGFNRYRMVHFSDLHLGFFMGEDQVRELTDVINQQQVDLICFTGDLLDRSLEKAEAAHHLEMVRDLFAGLNATDGKMAVLGNHDRTNDFLSILRPFYADTGFQLLLNETAQITRVGNRLSVIGLDDALKGYPNPGVLRETEQETFRLLLMHEPDYLDDVNEFVMETAYADLQLSGHSHGGQIRLPLLGAVITPPLGRKYVDQLYEPQSGKWIYTSRGTGTTWFPIRYLCRPEITVIELRDAKEVTDPDDKADDR